ncbi:MAG TPA: NAD-dependent epimerase/dehydratase family protein [Flavobacterium sp.]|nr:NAD-dependent epimerase/dehydratase family protein [Flavobacterium sp.]
MKRIFITGITGLLGTNLANALLDLDYEVTAIIRNPDKYIGKRTGNLNLVQMDLWGDYDQYLKETDIVVHIAAETGTHLIKYADYERTNYDATIRLFEKAKEQKVAQFIFISTANTIGYGSLKALGNETKKIQKPFTKLFYAQSKLQAEKYLLTQNKEIQIKILNPTFMIGAYDSKPSSGKIILMGLKKRIVFYPPGGKNFVPVKDVVNAIINAFHKGTSGEKYLIAGTNLSYKTFFKELRNITTQKQILIPIPKFLLLTVGSFGSFMRKLNIETSLSSSNMKTLCVKNYYTNQKSIRELNVQYSSLNNAIKEAADYLERTHI